MKSLAERVGFEPTIPVKVCPLSRRIVSTTHAPLRKNSCQRSAVSSAKKATANDQRLTAVFKEKLQQLCRTSGQHPAPDIHLMMQTGVVHHLQNRMDGACLRVVGTIHQTADASENCRSRAHGARLNCSEQFAVDKPVVAD